MYPPPDNSAKRAITAGFTLIELSIVLVIIGLIVGGILVGQSLISAAAARAQIGQIEKYNTAVNTFRDKYGGIPGDLSVASAVQFGITVGTGCTGSQGNRDGNGLLDGAASPNLYSQGGGETGLFWQDLSSAGLLDFSIAGVNCSGCPSVSLASLSQYFPAAKVGNGTYVYVYENGGANWFGVAGVSNIATCGNMTSTGAIPVIQAYNMDKKIDDGFPQTGNVQAMDVINQTAVSGAYNTWGPADSSQCFDGNPVIFPTTGAYSINAAAGNNANLPNCALSFKFQ